MPRIAKALARIEAVLTGLGAASLFVIMILVAADVLLRYAVGRPLPFTYDLVGVYLMTGVFFFVLSHAQAAHVHVAVDILVGKFSAPMRRLAEVVTCVTGGSVFALITYTGYERALDSYQSNDVLAGVIPWPLWPSIALVPIGSGVLVMRLLLTACGHIASLLTGLDVTPPPPLPSELHGGGFE
jgi:TRAP-type C4-dicarboxylate transport system permease small subunit